MIIEITKHLSKPTQAVLIGAVGFADEPNEDGLYLTEFYPAQPLLDLRHSETELLGHPYLDLAADSDKPPLLVEPLTRSEAMTIARHVVEGRMVAIGIRETRGRKLRRNAARDRRRRRSNPMIYYVDPGDYLSQEDLWWLKNICEVGFIFADELKDLITEAQTKCKDEK